METTERKIRVLIVDDIEEIRSYFRMVLEKEKDIEVVATAQSGEEAVSLTLQTKPDIVLMDVEMETATAGIEALQKIKAQMPGVLVIMLTIHEEDDVLFEAYGQQASDFITKTSSVVEVLDSIRNVYHHRVSLRPELTPKILKQFSRMYSEQSSLIYTLNIMSKLTRAEFEILRAVYDGKTYRQIARSRCVEEVTIRTQVNKILKKFSFSSMRSLVKSLREQQIFEIYHI